MVYNTFAFKYGIGINWNETHAYMFTLRCYKGINHIECIPTHRTFKALVNFEWVEMDKNDLDGKMMVFKSFGDGGHFLTGGLDIKDAYNVKFNLVEVDIVSKLTGYPSITSVFINKDDLDFEFVAETFDKDLQS